MFRPAKMQKIRVIGMRRDEPALISSLHTLGLLEIRKVEGEEAGRENPLHVYQIVSEQLTRIRGIKNLLEKQPGEKENHKSEMPLEQAIAECGKIKIDARLRELEAERERIEERIDSLAEKKEKLAKLAGLDVDFGKLEAETIECHAGIVKRKKYEILKGALAKTKNTCMMKGRGQTAADFACVVCAPKKENVKGTLEAHGFEFVQAGKIAGTPLENIAIAEEEIHKQKKRLAEIGKEYEVISKEYYGKIIEIDKVLKIWEARCTAVSDFRATEETFILHGWLLEKNYWKLHEELKRRFGGRIFVSRIKGKDEPPTLLANPKPFSPFEFLVEFFSLPRAREIDPSMILALTFPILYGMMVGDVGYGIISLLLAGMIIAKTKPGMLRGFAVLWAIASIPSMIFGILFDEWFGFTFKTLMEEMGVHVGGSFLVVVFGSAFHLSRLHDIGTLLLITILVGVLHLSLGLFLGFVNEWGHSKTHAMAKLGWIGILASGLLLVPHLMFSASLLALPIDEVLAGGIIFAVSLLLVVRADGIMGVFEIPGIAGNALSYARIAAVGIAGVVVAEAIINKLLFEGVALPNRANPFVFFLVCAVVLLLHIANTFLAMFESLVQGARLNLVEFYGKFFHGGGKKFSPFSMEEK